MSIYSNLSKYTGSLVGLVGITLLGTVVGKGLRYLLNFIIGRGLGAEALGIFTFGLVVVKAGGTLSSVGLRTASQRLIAVENSAGNERRLAGVTLVSLFLPMAIGTIVGGGLYLVWPILGRTFDLNLSSYVRLFFLGVPVYAAMEVGASASRGFKQTKYFVYIREIGQSGAAVLFVGVVVLVAAETQSIILAYLVSLVIGTVLAGYFLYNLANIGAVSRPVFAVRETLTVSLPLLIVAASQYLVSWTDILVLGFQTTAAEVGYYQSAFLYASTLIIVVQGINSIFPALAADLYEQGNLSRLETIYTAVTKWGFYLTGFGTLFVLIFASELLWVFGPNFVVAETTLIVLAIGRGLSSLFGPASYILTMTKYERIESLNAFALGLLNLVLNLVLIPQYGILGAAIATATSLLSLNIIRVVQVHRYLRIYPYNRLYWKGCFGLILTAGVLSIVKMSLKGLSAFVLSFVLGSVCFFGLLWLLGLDREDRLLFDVV